MKKKLFSLLMMVAMVLTALLPTVKSAYAEEQTTNVNIHKILAAGGFNDEYINNFNDNTKENSPNYNGKLYNGTKELSSDIYKNFGKKPEDTKEIAGVYFLAVPKVATPEVYNALYGNASINEFKSGQAIDVSNIDNYLAAVKKFKDGTYKVTTGSGNLVLPDGEYEIYEIKEKSTYVGSDSKLLDSMKAVPISLELPYYSTENGTTTRASVLHLYPKNTENGPNIEKDVTTVGNKHETAGIGQDVTWYLTVTLPPQDSIDNYHIFNIGDTLTTGLTFNKGSLKVYKFAGDKKNNIGDAIELNKVATIEEKDNGFTLDFITTKPGDDKNKWTFSNDILKYVKGGGQKLVLEYTSRVNENALIGQVMPNKVELNYGQNPNEKTQTKTPEPPEVHTGGKQFIKVNEGVSEGLAGAVFRIARVQGNPNAETAEGTIEYWAEDTVNKTRTWLPEAEVKDNYKFVETEPSKDNGYFEIKGLPYGATGNEVNTGSANYFLKEVTAPSGYALNTELQKFTVNNSSYEAGIAEAKFGELKDKKNVDTFKNKKQTIPQTGGIGTVVFTVVGLLLMVTSFVALRKRASHSK